MLVDRKYVGVIMKADHTVIHDWVILRAKDPAVASTLRFYQKECEALGCDNQHLKAIEELIIRVERYQSKQPQPLKLADTVPEDIFFNPLD